MVTIRIEEENLLGMLMERVGHWTEDNDVYELYERMYQGYMGSGIFDAIDFDVKMIVDNDYINYCNVVCEGDDTYDEIKAIYDEQGLGDCSCESENYSYIEAEYNDMFLVRV